MHYVYILGSVNHPKQRYVGQTADLRQRLNHHNEGKSPHTAKYRPWHLICYHAFAAEATAVEFEHYLKSGSVRAFARKRLDV